MVTTTGHGGGCCGMRHIHGFGGRHGGAVGADSQVLRTQTFTGDEWSRYGQEVILSDMQTRDDPTLMRTLADLGYVYTEAWTGRHGTPIHRFSRLGQRLPLTAGIQRFNWTGQVAGEQLSGNLPFTDNAPRQNGNQQDIRIGSRVRINSPQSRHNNREARVLNTFRNAARTLTATVEIVGGWGRTDIIVDNLVLLEGAAPVGAAPMRHPTDNNGPARAAPNVPAPQPPAAPRREMVLEEYFAVFQNGRSSGPYESIVRLRQANPRVLNYRRRRIYNDGRIENHEARVPRG